VDHAFTQIQGKRGKGIAAGLQELKKFPHGPGHGTMIERTGAARTYLNTTREKREKRGEPKKPVTAS